MSYKNICKWCMRYDCKEKGGPVEQCPVDRNEGPTEETQRLTMEFLKKQKLEENVCLCHKCKVFPGQEKRNTCLLNRNNKC